MDWGSALGFLMALTWGVWGLSGLDRLRVVLCRDDLEHRRREAGEGFYDTWTMAHLTPDERVRAIRIAAQMRAEWCREVRSALDQPGGGEGL